MIEIKTYSTQFATKLAYVLEISKALNGTGIMTAIAQVTKEKDTTARNWLFNGRIPREPKRLLIADAIGTSEEYLFNDLIAVTDIKKPEIVKNNNCYFVPVVDQSTIFANKNCSNFPVTKRLPIMLPHMDKLVATYGKNIYATQISHEGFQPYIEKNATLIYSEKIILEDYRFVLIQNQNGEINLKRIIKLESGFKLLHYSNDNREIIESIPDKNNMLIVLLSFSTA